MIIFTTSSELKTHLSGFRSSAKTIAFVPTMGALHDGHLHLIATARAHADITVCSIFVNPTQFNDPKDLEKYPRPIEQDIALLESHNCDILFLPSEREMYPEGDQDWQIDLGDLDQIWEGAHRPGHFQGVTQIVYKLFVAVSPDIALFGQKDYQQVMVIRSMLEIKNLEVKLLVVPTQREHNGLARSSRNARLSEEGRAKSAVIFQALRFIEENIRQHPISFLEKKAKEIIHSVEEIKIEYLAICDSETLKPAHEYHFGEKLMVLAAVWLEGVRLIDNIEIG